jgi:hypothetical protein
MCVDSIEICALVCVGGDHVAAAHDDVESVAAKHSPFG